MGIDENTPQTLDPESLDKPHPTHIRREIIDLGSTFNGAFAIVFIAQIQTQILHPRHALVPFGQGFFIHGAESRKPLFGKISRECASNKTPRPANDDQVVFVERCRCYLPLSHRVPPKRLF